MPSQLDQLYFTFNRKVTNGAPLAFFNIPSPEIGRDLKLVGTGKYTDSNKDGISVKNYATSITFNSILIGNTFAVSGIIRSNIITDPSFLYGVAGTGSATWSNSGIWTSSVTEGRTSSNSTYDSSDAPAIEQGVSAQLPCAKIAWANGTSLATLTSSAFPARVAGQEANYNIDNVVYQLSLWIASDPVDSYGVRRGANSWEYQSVSDTRLIVSVLGYNSTGGIVDTLWTGRIGWPFFETRNFLTQRNKTYLKFRSPYLKVTSDIANLVVKVEGTYAQGIYIDDVRLRSYSYNLLGNTSFGGNSGSSNRNQESIAGPNFLGNPELRDDSYSDGDFDNVFRNLITTDPSFENGRWTTYSGGTIKTGQDNLGSPRTGNRYLEVDGTGEGAYITLTGLSSGLTYRFSGYHRAENTQGYQSGYTNKRSVAKIELRNSGGTLLATLTSPQATGGNTYEQFTWNWSSSGYPTTASWRVLIENVTAGGFTDGHIWDDIGILEAVDPIADWTFYSNQAINSNIGVLSFDEAFNRFVFGSYLKTGSNGIFHYIHTYRSIYKNNLYQLSLDFCNRYFNTQHKMVSNPVAVSNGGIYGINFSLMWMGARQNITLDMDPSVRGAFAEPFRITYIDPRLGGSNITNINQYGNLTLLVEGVDNSNNVTETLLTYEIGPERGNLPTESFYDSKVKWNYAQITPPQFQVRSASTTKARVTFKWKACVAGVRTITLQQYTLASSGATGSSSNLTLTASGLYGSNSSVIKVYQFSNKISVDKLYVDKTNAWRLGVKDGIFERRYTMTSLEPSGSWLRSVGFQDGEDLVLVYTLPEYNLGIQWLSPSDPNFIRHLQEVYRERCSISDDKTLVISNGNLVYISEIRVNNTVIVSGTLSGTTSIQSLVNSYSGLIESIDAEKGLIKFTRSFSDKDIIEVSYFYKEDRYIYSGYYDGSVWHDLDFNPSAGHRWHYGEDNKGQAGYSLVNNGITLYLLPTSAYRASGDTTSVYDFKTAYQLTADRRPSCFLRHVAGVDVTEGELPSYPSASIIGKVFVTPPGSINDVDIVDIRSRGGGYPEEWDETYKPVDFIEETRYKIPVANESWLFTGQEFYDKDFVTIYGFGAASGVSGNAYQIIPSNSLWVKISSTTPTSGTSGDYLIGNSWTRNIGYTYNGSGSYYTASGQAATGRVYFKVINPNKGQSGELYVKVRTKRKFTQTSVWDKNSWDGEPVMLNGVVVVEVPVGVLTGSGYRKMTSQEVEEAVRKNVAAGVHAIIRYV